MSSSKGFGLTTLAVKNAKTVFLIAVVIIIGGLGAYQTMPKENFPELKIPEIYIGIAKPGSSPKYMSEKISTAIEKEIGGIKLVDEINSNSVHDRTNFLTRISMLSALRTEFLKRVTLHRNKAHSNKENIIFRD